MGTSIRAFQLLVAINAKRFAWFFIPEYHYIVQPDMSMVMFYGLCITFSKSSNI